MRQIKFRAWDKEKAKFLTVGELYKSGELNEQFTYNPERGSFIELSQFTGLLDKNGKEIYEGDVVEGPMQNGFGSFSQARGFVFFNTERAAFAVEVNAEGYLEFEWTIGKSIEIIGNTYENPDLISVEKEV